MRKVTERAAEAMRQGYNYQSGNTVVHSNGSIMDLHGNTIAIYGDRERKLTLRDCGWRTATTKERLNGILQTFGIQYTIYQHNGNWILAKLNDRGLPVVNTLWQGFYVFDLSDDDSLMIENGRPVYVNRRGKVVA